MKCAKDSGHYLPKRPYVGNSIQLNGYAAVTHRVDVIVGAEGAHANRIDENGLCSALV